MKSYLVLIFWANVFAYTQSAVRLAIAIANARLLVAGCFCFSVSVYTLKQHSYWPGLGCTPYSMPTTITTNEMKLQDISDIFMKAQYLSLSTSLSLHLSSFIL